MDKMDKNYLGPVLSIIDLNGDQIIDHDEWYAYFSNEITDISPYDRAKELVCYLLEELFPDRDRNQIPYLANAILISCSDTLNDNQRELNFDKLYEYVIKFIAPQKYKHYQDALLDRRKFFLYDGVMNFEQFQIFIQDERVLTADIFYMLMSYRFHVNSVFELLDCLIKELCTDYQPHNFLAEGVFETLSQNNLITIDSICSYAKHKQIHLEIDGDVSLFSVHYDIIQKIKSKKIVSAEDASHFLGYKETRFLEKSLEVLFEALDIDASIVECRKLFDKLNYSGNAMRIFKELSALHESFDGYDVLCFLEDNQIKGKFSKKDN